MSTTLFFFESWPKAMEFCAPLANFFLTKKIRALLLKLLSSGGDYPPPPEKTIVAKISAGVNNLNIYERLFL